MHCAAHLETTINFCGTPSGQGCGPSRARAIQKENSVSINTDMGKRVVLDTNAMAWLASPASGVWRKPLDRDGGEVARATSIVRYDPGAAFNAHSHDGGEEVFVLEGVFEDDEGRYPAGSYLRNPPGSSHAPGSTGGCKLLVKLRQFQQGDADRVRINTGRTEWLQGLVPGLSVMPLHQFGHENVALVRWQAQTFFQAHSHVGGEEIFVLDGVFEDEFGAYPIGTWMRSPHMSRHQPFSHEGCTILVKTGHLPA